MDVYEHFKLRKPPFDPRPDVDFFFDAPAHAEVLATLQYAVVAGKGCCAVVGEPGCGKTLLARVVVSSVAETTPVLWVHGGAQPRDRTNVSVYPPRRKRRRHEDVEPRKTTLAAEIHGAECHPEPPVLIVDCADELRPHGWADVIAWCSNELCYPKSTNLLLFGLPRLLDILTSADLVRLQRRVFRVCRLEPFTPELGKDYIRARITMAGGNARGIFSDETMEHISREGNGNPALINRLCDNALLEAFGEGRDRVVGSDVGNALHAMLLGRLNERAALPAPAQPMRPALPPDAGSPAWGTPEPSSAAAPVAGWPESAAKTGEVEEFVDEVEDFVDTRLKQFADRVSQALSVVNQVKDGLDKEAFPSKTSRLRTVAAESTTV